MPPETVDIDDIDRTIIGLLLENARRTFGDIGGHVGLSAPAVKRRIDRLEAVGVVTGYTCLFDYNRLGLTLSAFIELRFDGSAKIDDIGEIAKDIPEVLAVFTIAGDPDALAWIRARDVNDLKLTIDKLRNDPSVVGTRTHIVLNNDQRFARPSNWALQRNELD